MDEMHVIRPRPPASAREPRHRPASASLKTPLLFPTRPARHAMSDKRHRLISEMVLKEEIAYQRQVTVRTHQMYLKLEEKLALKKIAYKRVHRRVKRISLVQQCVLQETIGTERIKNVCQDMHPELIRQKRYKDKLVHVCSSLQRHIQLCRASADSLTDQKARLDRDVENLKNRFMLERNMHTELEQRRQRLNLEREKQEMNTARTVESIQAEYAIRLTVLQQRCDSDERRQRIVSTVNSAPQKTMSKLNNLSQSPRSDRAEIELDTNAIERYNAMYQKLLFGTSETDGRVLLERYQMFRENSAQLLKLERDLILEQQTLKKAIAQEKENEWHESLPPYRKLADERLSEEMRKDACIAVSNASFHMKDKWRMQMASISGICQGILNVHGILQCLQEKQEPRLLFHDMDNENAIEALSRILHQCLDIAMQVSWNPGTETVEKAKKQLLLEPMLPRKLGIKFAGNMQEKLNAHDANNNEKQMKAHEQIQITVDVKGRRSSKKKSVASKTRKKEVILERKESLRGRFRRKALMSAESVSSSDSEKEKGD